MSTKEKTVITFQKLTKDNFKDAIKIKHLLFPESNSDEDYDKYFDDEVKANYYLIFFNNCPCATIGWYDFDNTEKEAFIGWFGVLPEYQRKGIGEKAVQFIIDEVKSLNYSYLRVYTDRVVNYASTVLYDKLFDLKEDYLYPDKIGLTKNFVVYTKFLKDKHEQWNNRPLNEDENYDF